MPTNLNPSSYKDGFGHLLKREDLKAQIVTQLPKQVRIRDKSAVEQCHDIGRCEACGTTDNWESHHIKTRGAGGDDKLENLVSLCRECHQKAHAKVYSVEFLLKLVAKRRKRK